MSFPSCHELSTRKSLKCQSSVNRVANGVLLEVSIEGIYRHLTVDASSTHVPKIVLNIGSEF